MKEKKKKKRPDEAAKAAQVDSDRAAELFRLKEAEARKRVVQAEEADERKPLRKPTSGSLWCRSASSMRKAGIHQVPNSLQCN
jgi:hypothetical protein